jgi:hypothetical protein
MNRHRLRLGGVSDSKLGWPTFKPEADICMCHQIGRGLGLVNGVPKHELQRILSESFFTHNIIDVTIMPENDCCITKSVKRFHKPGD